MEAPARLDLAIGHLGPRVSSSAGPMSARSGGSAYEMPAFGYARRSGNLVYGLAMFAQGGMGTEYGADSFLAMGSGRDVRSELGVGRMIAPLAWKVSDKLSVGGSLDLVWSTLDIRMAASGAQLGQMVTGASGQLAAALPALGGAPWARVDFSDQSKFSGEAVALGWAGKLGLVYRLTPALTLGASWHSKTALRDMKTGQGAASLSATGGFVDSGRMTIEGFQMPAQLALGAAWQVTPTLGLAADVKRVQWAPVMQALRMRYDSAMMGGSVSFALPQQWQNQTVTSLGLAWSATPGLTLRAGFNTASNPVPDAYVLPLFPATVRHHYSAGFSLASGAQSDIHMTVSRAPASVVQAGSGVSISHSQLNAQLMFSLRF
jgi:long-chain fatty acid transport protein